MSTLNRCDHLRRTLVALRDQTYEEFEVVVVNGPSVDGTSEMLSSFCGKARLTTCDVASLGRSRNIGVEAAAGEIVAFIDDDAIPRADWLEKLTEPYTDESVVAAGGPVFDVPLDRVAWALCTCTRLGVPNPNSEGPIERYIQPGADPLAYLPGCNMSFRRSVLQEVGGFSSLLIYNYDDVEICSRLIDHGHRICLVEDVLVRHDRAPNAARDGQDAIRDPYPALYCRAVFASQCGPLVMSATGVAAVMRRAADDMIEIAHGYVGQGRLTPSERDAFAARARAAVEEGLEAGSRARPTVAYPEVSAARFRRYR